MLQLPPLPLLPLQLMILLLSPLPVLALMGLLPLLLLHTSLGQTIRTTRHLHLQLCQSKGI